MQHMDPAAQAKAIELQAMAKSWNCIYPAYINSKLSLKQGKASFYLILKEEEYQRQVVVQILQLKKSRKSVPFTNLEP